jgi:hypothetical protein
MTLDEHLAYLQDLAKRNEQREAKRRAAARPARPWVPPDIPEQRAFEAARVEMYESQARLTRAQTLVKHRNLSVAQRQEAMAMLRGQKVAMRLAVKAMNHAGKLRNEAEKELERRQNG